MAHHRQPRPDVGSVVGAYQSGLPSRLPIARSKPGTGGTGEINLNGRTFTFQARDGRRYPELWPSATGTRPSLSSWTNTALDGDLDGQHTHGHGGPDVHGYGWLTGAAGPTTATTATGTTTTTAGGGGGIPTVTNASPASATHGVATSITITGTNFTGTTTVRFGVASASFTVNSSTQITATTPTGLGAGSQPITVTNASGTSSGYAFTLT
jgi:hypothetical protein